MYAFREGNHPDDYSRVTYRKLMDQVCQFANALRDCGVGKGDRVSIYMPMILETVVCMLACARIGAIHSVVVSKLALFLCKERKHFPLLHYDIVTLDLGAKIVLIRKYNHTSYLVKA